jgi:hypothetical protein
MSLTAYTTKSYVLAFNDSMTTVLCRFRNNTVCGCLVAVGAFMFLRTISGGYGEFFSVNQTASVPRRLRLVRARESSNLPASF